MHYQNGSVHPMNFLPAVHKRLTTIRKSMHTQQTTIQVSYIFSFQKASNIKDSGSIEQDADLIILITREKSEATLHVVKNRNGATGSVECNFNGNACLFSNEKQYDYEYL